MLDNNTKLINTLHKIYFILITIFIYQCSSYHYNSSSHKKSNRPVSINKEDLLNAQFYFYRNSDTSITFYSLINTDPLLYSRLDTGLQFYASVKINIYLYSVTKNTLTDSATKIFHIPQKQNKFFSSANIHGGSDDYSVKIFITDLNKKSRYIYYTELKLNNDNERNNFLITYKDSLLFKPFAIEGSNIKIYHRKKYPSVYVDVFKYNHTPAPPPFSNITPSLNYIPDSSFKLMLTEDNYYQFKTEPFKYYHIRISQNQLEGISIFSIDSIFPNIKNSKEMLYTTRYIMNKNEYEKCLNLSSDQETKKCIDNFWIQIGGSKERAKEVIKNYYQRVIEANKLFTSYKYGWQTDRGMIYIIFGPPEDIQKSLYTEKWYYSFNGQKNALIFTFNKNKNNPFTNADFILERSDYYKDIWYITVDKIRQGRLNTK